MRILVSVAVLGLLISACGGDEAADTTIPAAGDQCAKENLTLVEPGVLTIATGEPAFPPWIIDDDPTNKQGFEGAVAYAIAEQLGFTDDEVTWVRTGFDEAIQPGPKSFDFNIQQYSITPDRDEAVDFSVPYYVTAQALVAFEGSPIAGATTLADLKTAKLGAAIGTTSLDYIEQIIQPDEAPAVYDENVDAKAALEAGQIDALVVDLPTAYFITAVEIEGSEIAGVLEASEAQADRYGLLFAEGNPLVACVNQAIEGLRADGTLAGFEQEWLEQAGDLRTITP